MTTDNHTQITTGAAAISSTFNNPMGELDAAIGDLSGLATTEKGSAVGAINEALVYLVDMLTNRHLDLDGTDETVQLDDSYLQVDSISAATDLILPAISDFGVGREITIRLASGIGDGYTITLVPDSGDGDAIIGGSTINPVSTGGFVFRTVASYPGETGACWVLMTEGTTII